MICFFGRFAVLLGLCALVWTQTGFAQPRARRLRTVRTTQIAEWLNAPETANIQRGIEGVGLAGSRDAVRLLEDRIRRGLPPDLLLLAVNTLGATGRGEAGPLLGELLSHRRATVRVAAVRALADLAPRSAEAKLVGALSDPAPTVRAAAAESLGHVGTSESVDALFLAFDRGIEEAATSLGQLARDEDVPRIVAYLGDRSLETLSPALLELLSRRDIQTATKLSVITRLSEMATSDVREFLDGYGQSLPDRAPDELRRAVEASVARIPR